MNHIEKLQLMRQHLTGLGLRQSTIEPPFYRFLWRLGFEVPPPLFASFASLALLQGTFFGVLWGLAMWVCYWSWQMPPVPGYVALMAAAVAGLLFGLVNAAFLRAKARKLRLPHWSSYTGEHSGSGPA